MRRGLLLLARLVVGGVFVVAGLLKLADPAAFATDIANYRLVPHGWQHLLAALLPGVEVVAGGALLAGWWTRASALLVAGLLVAFLVAIGQALGRGLDLQCGCFGTAHGAQVGAQLFAQDVALLAVTLWIWWRTGEQPKGR